MTSTSGKLGFGSSAVALLPFYPLKTTHSASATARASRSSRFHRCTSTRARVPSHSRSEPCIRWPPPSPIRSSRCPEVQRGELHCGPGRATARELAGETVLTPERPMSHERPQGTKSKKTGLLPGKHVSLGERQRDTVDDLVLGILKSANISPLDLALKNHWKSACPTQTQ